ncbi:MBL fold metallo-hydrolase [Celerinatantimonas diazotrophica]|uniref:L-ascorbate metabolism protein UlaG (Beta-lactamase superfamily) n=1 Tax=Celerinatantimonas diazotrophica TaxID=412034 RepID=A0A4R1KBU2_9GAMM|nr:MBL fold metallo-hydrolase [Celerinatantimonas diazotrophica]TCK61480.1 L-ascorbate metabolism protein UlaG (beta-lactamase superfamily) [Celerinatantimonas diazotrophica]CAG9296943.1 hypothetical protein CEDIAZO_02105 [Celerinatantimonas diazotrophica]
MIWFIVALVVIITIVVSLVIILSRAPYKSANYHPLSPNTLRANYRDKQFHNDHMPQHQSATNESSILFRFLFQRIHGARPNKPIATDKTNLLTLDPQTDLAVWLGHSSSFIQLDGMRFLIDPVFSNNASPIPATNRAFAGSNIYVATDMPAIDYLLITHDHWDHLDYPSIVALKEKVHHVIVPLGVGGYFRQWGYPDDMITECDWNQHTFAGKVTVVTLPAQHFSGRLFHKNRTLWASYALLGEHKRIFLSGDSGYSSHFAAIAEQYGPFDLTFIECGQYDTAWPHVHMTPEQSAQAAADLKSKLVITQHHSKFKLAFHRWQEPIERFIKAKTPYDYQLTCPMIGQCVTFNDPPCHHHWWQNQHEYSLTQTITAKK